MLHRRVDGVDGGDGGDDSEPDEGNWFAATGTTYLGIPGVGIVKNSKKTVDSQLTRLALYAASLALEDDVEDRAKRGASLHLSREGAMKWLARARKGVIDKDPAFQSALVKDASALQLIVTTIVAGESSSASAVNTSAWDSNHHAEHMGFLALARAEVARRSDEDPPPMVSFPQVACDECRATYSGFARVFDATAGDFCKICPKNLPPACKVSVYSWQWTRPRFSKSNEN